MKNVDPRQKADEFQNALKWIDDPKLRAAFTEFRDLWMALANKKQSLAPAQLVTEIEALNRIHSEWVSEGRYPRAPPTCWMTYARRSLRRRCSSRTTDAPRHPEW